MKTPNNSYRTRGFIHALLLAVLLNLCGHMFLHLGDAVQEAEETHWTTPHEPAKAAASPHQCSVCQDHQQLVLDAPSAASYSFEAPTQTTNRNLEFLLVAPTFSRPSDRAPPRS